MGERDGQHADHDEPQRLAVTTKRFCYVLCLKKDTSIYRIYGKDEDERMLTVNVAVFENSVDAKAALDARVLHPYVAEITRLLGARYAVDRVQYEGEKR